MAKLKIQVNDGISKKIRLLEKDLPKIATAAERYFVAQTPVRTGNARRNTNLRNANSNKPVIHADYPYAGKLDEGSSSQAPKGMTKPTISYINKLIRQMIRKV